MISKSYRFDELSLAVFSPNYDEMDLTYFLESKGYKIREKKKDDEVRKAQGYNPQNAMMIELDGAWYTLQMRTEFNEDVESGKRFPIGLSGLIVLSSSDVSKVNLRELFKNLHGGCKATRFDVALDMTFSGRKKNGEGKPVWNQTHDDEMHSLHTRVSRLCGFSPSYRGGDVQNPNNAIRGGNKNPKTPIKTCSKTISNGLTLYIGSRSSKFMMRVYDKSAEVLKRTEKAIAPTLRFEIEVKQEYAQAVQKFVENSLPTLKAEKLAEIAWQNLTNDSITFEDSEVMTFTEVLGLNKTKTVTLDYSKIENEQMSFDAWVRRQVAPTFRRKYNTLSDEEKLEKLKELFLKDSKKENAVGIK